VADDSAQIRRARQGDLAAIVALFADDEASSPPAAGPPEGDAGPGGAHPRVPPAAAPPTTVPSASEHGTLGDGQREAFAAIDGDPNNQVYVAEREGKIVGTFQLTFIRQLSYGGCLVAQVESVHVHSSQRSHGIGRMMMDYAIAEARRRGALRIQLTSNVRRTRAHEFYERLGFRASHKGMKLYLR
jgi:GNAT superfamily N-acetyltransferase